MARFPLRFPHGADLAPPFLSGQRFGAREAPMPRIFDMDDRARLPWRFHGRGLRLRAGA